MISKLATKTYNNGIVINNQIKLLSKGFCTSNSTVSNASLNHNSDDLFRSLFTSTSEGKLNPLTTKIKATEQLSNDSQSFMNEFQFDINPIDTHSSFKNQNDLFSPFLQTPQKNIYKNEGSVIKEKSKFLTGSEHLYNRNLRVLLNPYFNTYMEAKYGNFPNIESYFLFIENIPANVDFSLLKAATQEISIPKISNFHSDKVLDSPSSGVSKGAFITFSLPKQESDEFKASIIKRLSLFGLTINGLRLKYVDPENLKSLKLSNISQDLTSEKLLEILESHWEEESNGITWSSANIKVKFTDQPKQYHSIQQQTHSGSGYITASSHEAAVITYILLNKISFQTQPKIHWSRTMFTDGALSPDIISVITRSNSKKLGEIDLMKQIIDLKEKVADLEAQLEKKNNKKN